ncbi:MAG TPA: hypothetical protein V6C50_02525 [Crinalium sp.]
MRHYLSSNTFCSQASCLCGGTATLDHIELWRSEWHEAKGGDRFSGDRGCLRKAL